MHLDLLIVCCFSHSAHWLPTRKKLLYTVANPARGLLNREKKKKKKSGSVHARQKRTMLPNGQQSRALAFLRMAMYVKQHVEFLSLLQAMFEYHLNLLIAQEVELRSDFEFSSLKTRYIWSSYISRVWINRVANPARGQLNCGKMNISLSPFAPDNLVS